MTTRRPPGNESTERNSPSVEAAFQAVPPELVAEILDGELHVSPHPARPHTNTASSLGILIGGPFMFGRGGPGGWFILDEPETARTLDIFRLTEGQWLLVHSFTGEETVRAEPFEAIGLELALVWSE